MMRFETGVSDSTHCLHCGTHVSEDFRRTLGDEDNVAHRCPGCDSRARLAKGTAAGKEVPYPDPADQPVRNSGPRVRARPGQGEGQ